VEQKASQDNRVSQEHQHLHYEHDLNLQQAAQAMLQGQGTVPYGTIGSKVSCITI